MALTEKDLEKIAQLAYLDCELDSHQQLVTDLNSIMNFVEQLRQIDTNNVAPLFHPLDLTTQRLRIDEVSEQNSSTELAKTASSFEEGCYLVPKIIDSGL